MLDSAQEIRNSHITKEEGLALIEKFDGEFPKKYQDIFLRYINMDIDEFNDICDNFRPKHIWEKENNLWKLKISPSEFFKTKKN